MTSDDYRLITNVRLDSQLSRIQQAFAENGIRASYTDTARGTLISVHVDDYDKAQALLVDFRMEEVQDSDLSQDDG